MRPAPTLLLAAALVLAACSSPEAEPDGTGRSASVSTAPSSATSSSARTSPGRPPTHSAAGSGRPSATGPVRPRVVHTVASGLTVPWGVTFLPGGTALVGERISGRVVAVDGDRVRDVGRVPGVVPDGEGGLLGLATSPSFDRDHLLYAYLSAADDNRVVRMTYEGTRLGPAQPVLTGIPKGSIHNGGRLLFAKDGTLFVSTGETGDSGLAQDRGSLGGKILHVTAAGAPAADNPSSGSPVWTWGHRNVEGLTFDDRGRLWATEFGQDTWDEVNLIRKGEDYGWPVVEGRGGDDRFTDPEVVWHTEDASPSGVAFSQGSLWVGALRGERLWQVPLTGTGTGEPRAWFVGDYGRLRTVVVAPDGNLWVTTSNRDGRGDPTAEDDRILEIALR